MKQEAYLMPVFNAHMPFVRSNDALYSTEGNWLFETIAETYLPMLEMFDRLEEENIEFKVTISISPTLLSMIDNDAFIDSFITHMEHKIRLGESEFRRSEGNPSLNKIAGLYLERFKGELEYFKKNCGGRILGRLLELSLKGRIELITSAATYAFLPLLRVTRRGVETQIDVGLDIFEEHIGRKLGKKPTGFWLPECGYSPGLEYYLEDRGIKYSFLDTHGVLFAEKKPKYGIYAPIKAPNGVTFFGRDILSTRDVWSASSGYLNDISYRDSHRDIGFELPSEYLKKFFPERKVSFCTGYKYRSRKEGVEENYYDPEVASRKALEHAENFVYRRINNIEKASEMMDRSPVIVFAYDAELFGHMWYEGIEWMENVFRIFNSRKPGIKFITGEDYLEMYPENQPVLPSYSSWSEAGYSEELLDKENDWIYRHIHKSMERMNELARRYGDARGIIKRALNQAAREALLAQSSDWALMIKTYQNSYIGSRRIKEHLYNFNRLYSSILADRIDEQWLVQLEKSNNIFPKIDYKIFKD